MSIYERFSDLMLSERLVQSGEDVFCGYSGGADSSVLLCLLNEFNRREGYNLNITVLHLNHGIRPEADNDEAFCGKFCEQLGVSFISEKKDVPVYSKDRGVSIETGARQCRHAFFKDHTDRIFLGHHSDDAAETVLFNLVRGTGFEGMTGISIASEVDGLKLVRPLLLFSREDIRQYASDNGIAFAEDKSNNDSSYSRNRIRNEIIPLLEKINPSAKENILRTSSIIRDGWEIIRSYTRKRADELTVSSDNTAISLKAGELVRSVSPSFILYEVFTRLGIEPDFSSIQRILSLARRMPGGTVCEQLKNGASASLEYGTLILSADSPSDTVDRSAGFRAEIPVPGKVTVAELGFTFSAGLEAARSAEEVRNKDNPLCEYFDSDLVGGGAIVIRQRKDGDMFHPLGGPGRRKLQDFLVDLKVPARERGRLAVAENGKGEIIWVCGKRISEKYKVTPSTVNILRLEMTETEDR